jgi:hypothetical protein
VKQEFWIKNTMVLLGVSSFSVEYNHNNGEYFVHTLFVTKWGRLAPKKQDALKTILSLLTSEIFELLASAENVSFNKIPHFAFFSQFGVVEVCQGVEIFVDCKFFFDGLTF